MYTIHYIFCQMFKYLFAKLQTKSSSIQKTALMLAVFTFSAQLLSLVRDRLFAGNVGVGPELDTYYYAFKIPDILYAVFSALVSTTVLIPLLTKHRTEDPVDTKNMKRVYDILFTVFFCFSSIVIAILIVIMPYVVHLIAPGVTDAGQVSNIVLYSRMLLLQPFFLGLSNLLGSYTQMRERFVIYAFSPVIYNISTVLGLVFLYPSMGMKGVVLGIILGSILHGLIQIPYIRKEQFLPSFARIVKTDLLLLKEVIMHSLPRALILSLVQIEFLFLNSRASLGGDGNTSILNFANNLQSVPLALIGVSFVVASFPVLAKKFSTGDEDAFWHIYKNTFKKIFFFTTIATVLAILLRKYVVLILLGNVSPQIALTFAIFVLSLAPQCIEMLITRVYYARGNTKTPAKLNIAAAIITIALAWIYGNSAAELAGAFTIGAWVSCLFFYIAIRKTMGKTASV